jgi:hypothetical protein
LSVAEDGEFEVAEALGVGDCFDFDDLSVCDGEAKHHEEASAWWPLDFGGQCRLGGEDGGEEEEKGCSGGGHEEPCAQAVELRGEDAG